MKLNKKNALSGTSDIMAFTLNHTVKTGGYMISTVLVALLLFVGLALVSIIPAILQEKDDDIAEPIHIYVTGDHAVDATFCSSAVENSLPNVIFEDSTLSLNEIVSAIGQTDENSNTAVLTSSLIEEDGKLTFILPEGCSISEDTAQSILDLITSALKQNEAALSGLPPAVIQALSMSVFTDVYSAGESSRSIGEILIDMLAPMIMALAVYMIIFLYGQTISKSIIPEKSSKLMETLLTSVRPYAIITGKVGALWIASLMQFIIWMITGIGGYFIGVYVSKRILPGYVSFVDELITLIREHTSPDAFSPAAITLGIVSLLLGIFFYFVFAAFASSKIHRAEDLSSGMAIFQMPVVIAFMLTYLLPLSGKNSAITALFPYIPFTAAFATPSSVMIGSTSLLTAVLSFIITLAATALLILLTGQNYKNNLFAQGKKRRSL